MLKEKKNEGSCYLIKWGEEKEIDSSPEIPAELLKVLELHDEVFQDPVRLPPSHNHDHAIHLQEGASIPNLRPCK